MEISFLSFDYVVIVEKQSLGKQATFNPVGEIDCIAKHFTSTL